MSSDSTTDADRKVLRRAARAARRTIQGPAREAAARRVAHHISAARLLAPGKRVGLFLSMPEEVDTGPLLALATRFGCRIALPRILSTRHARMRFFESGGALRTGPFGILEPGAGKMRRTRELDLVFVPLVAFDAHGHRMGMGRGFYDRCFEHRRWFTRMRRPLLIGVAYAVQQVDHVPAAPHDVPLDGIVTESSLRWFKRGDRT